MAQEESPYLRLELVAPAGPVFEGDVEMVVLPAVTGEMGILPRHAPLVAQLSIGRLRALSAEGEWLIFAVSEGFAKVQFNKVIVLADTAEEAAQDRRAPSARKPSSGPPNGWRCIARAPCLRARKWIPIASNWPCAAPAIVSKSPKWPDSVTVGIRRAAPRRSRRSPAVRAR